MEELTLIKKLEVKYTLAHLQSRYLFLAQCLFDDYEFNDEVKAFVERRALENIDKLGEVTQILQERFGGKFNKDLDALKMKFWGLVD